MVNAASFHIQFKNINVGVQMNLNVGQKDCDNLALKWDLVLSIVWQQFIKIPPKLSVLLLNYFVHFSMYYSYKLRNKG